MMMIQDGKKKKNSSVNAISGDVVGTVINVCTQRFSFRWSMTWVKEKGFFCLFRELIRTASHHQKEKPQADPLLSPLFFFTLQVFQSAVGGSFTVCFSLFFSRRLLLVVSLSYLSWILISAAMDNPRSQEDSTQKRIKTSIPFYRRKKEIHRIFIRNREHQPISFFPSFFRNFREGVKMRWGGKEIGTNVKPFAVDCAAMAGEQLLLLEGRRIYI